MIPGNITSSIFALATFLVGVLVAVFWMVVAWRAMRAHERLAASVEELGKPE